MCLRDRKSPEWLEQREEKGGMAEFKDISSQIEVQGEATVAFYK